MIAGGGTEANPPKPRRRPGAGWVDCCGVGDEEPRSPVGEAPPWLGEASGEVLFVPSISWAWILAVNSAAAKYIFY